MKDKPEVNKQTSITCPYCFEEDYDSWEIAKGELETEWESCDCPSCGKRFRWRRGFEIWYDSEGEDDE